MMIDYIFDVKDTRVSLEASTGFYLFIVLRIVFIQMFYCLSSMAGSLGSMSSNCVCCPWLSPQNELDWYKLVPRASQMVMSIGIVPVMAHHASPILTNLRFSFLALSIKVFTRATEFS